jgi:hypothetical protein
MCILLCQTGAKQRVKKLALLATAVYLYITIREQKFGNKKKFSEGCRKSIKRGNVATGPSG